MGCRLGTALEIRLAAENKAGKVRSIILTRFPWGTHSGKEFDEDREMEMPREMEMLNNFQVIRVHGHVRWKDHGSGDSSAVLILKRRNKKQIFGELDLAEYARGSSTDKFTLVQFDFEPHVQNPFWQRGAAGEISFHSHLLSH